MKSIRFSDEQIVEILKGLQAKRLVADHYRRRDIREAICRMWRSRYGGMVVSNAKKHVDGEGPP